MIIRKLAGQTLVYGLSTIIPKVVNYLLTPYLTYVALTEMDYGVISYMYAAIPFAFAVLLLGMETGFFRFTGKVLEGAVSGVSAERSAVGERGSSELVFTTVWGTTILLSALFLGLTVLFTDEIYALISMDFAPSIIPLVGGIIFLDVACATPFAKLREEGKPLTFSLIKGLSVLVNIVLTVFFYSALPLLLDNGCFSWMWIGDFGSGYIFVANLLASFVTLIVVMCYVPVKRMRVSLKLLRKILFFSIPLFIGGLAGTANEFLDRFFIKEFLPKEIAQLEVGYYSATLKITAVMVIFTQMYRYAAEPLFLARLKKSEFGSNNAAALTMYAVVSMFIFLVVTVYLDLFKYIVAPEYRSGMSLVPILLIGNALMGVLLNLNFWYKFIDKTYFAIIITGSGLAVSVITNVWLIPEMGIRGAAIAKLLSAVFMVAVSYYLNQRYYAVPYQLKRVGEYAILTALLYYVAQNIYIDMWVLDFVVRGMLILVFVGYVSLREGFIKLRHI